MFVFLTILPVVVRKWPMGLFEPKMVQESHGDNQITSPENRGNTNLLYFYLQHKKQIMRGVLDVVGVE